jgi:hypothetical protein
MAIPYASSYDGTLPFSDTCVQLTLTANNVQTSTIPGTGDKKYTVLFSYNQNQTVFVGKNTTPVLPAPNAQGTQQYVEYKPERRYVVGGDVLSFITPDATSYMGFSIRAIPN